MITMSFLLTNFVNSQSSQTNEKYQYCEIVGIQKPFKSNYNIVVNYGNDPMWEVIKDSETGKNKEFNSMIDALNYMAQSGWKFIQTFIISGANGNEIHFLLEKKTE